MKIIDGTNTQVAMKQNVLAFFNQPNFMDLIEVQGKKSPGLLSESNDRSGSMYVGSQVRDENSNEETYDVLTETYRQ